MKLARVPIYLKNRTARELRGRGSDVGRTPTPLGNNASNHAMMTLTNIIVKKRNALARAHGGRGEEGRMAGRGDGPRQRHVEQRISYPTKFRSRPYTVETRIAKACPIAPALNLPASLESSNTITRGGNC
ncbi:hypothetical protein ACJJTC_011890 [Scirpophaga incertulas]